jgi:DNA repair photolyase
MKKKTNRKEKQLQIIYEPAGKAKEYARLACNLYNGCTHGCSFCFAKRFKKSEYFNAAYPKKYAIEKLKKDVKKLSTKSANSDIPEILLSFQGDVYQQIEMELRLTRQAIELFVEYDLPFTVLTKGGTRAVRDFDLMRQSGMARFGTSLTWINETKLRQFEANAAGIQDRINAIVEAKKQGIPTWISLEPVIDPQEALDVVSSLHDIVDFWTVGKINHNTELERGINWLEFRENIIELFDNKGSQYYIKKSLSELMPKGIKR